MNDSLVIRIYECLRERLLVGEYPPGAHLDYKRISGELRVSTTPVREAVGRLAGDGLVDLIPRAGARVKRVEFDELLWLYEEREALELYACRYAVKRLAFAKLAGLEQLVTRMQWLTKEFGEESSSKYRDRICAEFCKLDLMFHVNIVGAAGNQRLTRIAENILLLISLAHSNAWQDGYQALVQINASHKAICEAIRARNEERCMQICQQHIKQEFELTLLAQRPSASVSNRGEADAGIPKTLRSAIKSRSRRAVLQSDFQAVV